MITAYDIYDSPVGSIYVTADATGVKRVVLTQESWEECSKSLGAIPRDRELCRQAVTQLEEYFSGKRNDFTVALSVDGTNFQKKVWNELIKIPYGETRNYGEIACAIDSPKACRAVGQANRVNPLPIFIPCHRVIGRDGTMTGYMGKQGIKIKEYLLDWERRQKGN
jgi:methylated-DNA-[protein]-cysteine S-methyltransferase